VVVYPDVAAAAQVAMDMDLAMGIDLVTAQVAMEDLAEVAAATHVAIDLTEVATQVAMDLNRRIQEEEED
jgi:hypothetical protein